MNILFADSSVAITQLLQAWERGDREARDTLFELLHPDLSAARSAIRRPPATALE